MESFEKISFMKLQTKGKFWGQTLVEMLSFLTSNGHFLFQCSSHEDDISKWSSWYGLSDFLSEFLCQGSSLSLATEMITKFFSNEEDFYEFASIFAEFKKLYHNENIMKTPWIIYR